MFTPLGTPAVTPMDSQFQVPEYAIPGEYFSPLASPALHAQSSGQEQMAYRSFPISDQSETTSPVDLNFDPSLQTAPTSAPATKRQKRKSPSAATRSNTRAVRGSPAIKPQRQRKKQLSSTVIPAKEVIEMMSTDSRPSTGGSQRQGDTLVLPASQFSSESGSISPEPISDLMPPPATPKPGSAGRSPYLASQTGSQSAPARPMNAPATPRSLMKIQEPSTAQADDIAMQDISLGEAALEGRPFLPNLNTNMVDTQSTPTMSAQTGEASVLASALSPTPVLPSPVASTAPTPKSAAAKGKNDFKTPAKSKKRNSSSHPSPALRPRISPSIKPLLPPGSKLFYLVAFPSLTPSSYNQCRNFGTITSKQI